MCLSAGIESAHEVSPLLIILWLKTKGERISSKRNELGPEILPSPEQQALRQGAELLSRKSGAPRLCTVG